MKADEYLNKLVNDPEFAKKDAEFRKQLIESYNGKKPITIFEEKLVEQTGLSIENVRNAVKTIGNRSMEFGFDELLDVTAAFKQLSQDEQLEFVNKIAGNNQSGFFLTMMKVTDDLLEDVLKNIKLKQ